ncbi:cyclase family protein, partial [Actinobaculum suis]|uniref:cyclase family protein n=1 Tax=Actinobaculum suis TaxID=1657 RepID=UPI000AB17F38
SGGRAPDRHPTTEKEYWTKSPWITKTGAEFLRKREIKAVAFDFPQDRGIRADYLDGFHPAADPAEDWACHMLLLTKGIVQIEYLSGLQNLTQDRFLFFAAPLKIKGSDGGPARAFALEEK